MGKHGGITGAKVGINIFQPSCELDVSGTGKFTNLNVSTITLSSTTADSILFNLVAKTEELKKDFIMETSGLDAFPEGLPVAKITDVTPGNNGLFQDVHGEALFQLSNGPLLFVIQ